MTTENLMSRDRKRVVEDLPARLELATLALLAPHSRPTELSGQFWDECGDWNWDISSFEQKTAKNGTCGRRFDHWSS